MNSGVFEALTDFGFTKYATPKLIRILYAIGLALILLFAVVFLITGLVSGEPVNIIAALIGAPLGALLYIIGIRVYAEVVSVIFQIAGSVEAIARGAGPASPGSGSQEPPEGG
jgi:glycopeptide antibiotics resistance protein